VTGLVSATVNVASGVFTLIMSLIYSVYFLAGKEKLIRNFKRLLYAFCSRRTANRISMFLTVSNNVFSSYVRGQLTECVILGVLCYIGMNIIGLEYALLISTILTLAALVPILGAYIGAALGALILLMVKPIDALWFLIFLVVLQQFEGNVIYPRVVGSSIGLPGIWTLTAVMIFGSLFGIPGIIIGTPTAAVAYKLLSYHTSHKLASKGITEEVLGGSEVMEQYGDIVKPSLPEEEEPGEHEKSVFARAVAYIQEKLPMGKKGKH
jgi:predicted PurR-regulated permease PerM